MGRPLSALVAMTVGVLSIPTVASAQIDQVKTVVNGMTCNLCAAGLERSLRKLDAVSKVRVTLDDQTAVVTLKPNAAFHADAFRAAVTDAGQELRSLELRLRGAVREHDGAYSLEARPGLLMAFGPASAVHLQRHAGKTIRVRARVSSPARAPLELDFIDIE